MYKGTRNKAKAQQFPTRIMTDIKRNNTKGLLKEHREIVEKVNEFFASLFTVEDPGQAASPEPVFFREGVRGAERDTDDEKGSLGAH